MRHPWSAGDLFLVPNLDGRFSVGQVIARERRTLQSASCAFFDLRVGGTDEGAGLAPDLARCISALLVTPDGLDHGVWPVVANRPVVLPRERWPYESLLSRKKPGATVHGTGIVRDFLDAFHGLRPWDTFYKPDYLDGLLLSPDKRPSHVILSRPAGK